MLTDEENQRLCRVEGNAPHGADDASPLGPGRALGAVGDTRLRPGAPAPFRGGPRRVSETLEGRIGVLGEHCPHRKASLFFGRNEECGLRCLYHGWKFDVTRATSWRCRPSRLPAVLRIASSTRPIPLGKPAASFGLSGSGGAHAGLRGAAVGADAGSARLDRADRSSVQLGTDHGGADRLGAQLEPAFLRHAARSRDLGGALRHIGRAPPPTRIPGCRSRLPITACAMRPFGAPYERRHA